MPLVRKPSAPDLASAIPAAQSDLLKLLTSGNQDERWAAARAAATVASGANIIAKALWSESDPRVREAMFTSLARINSIESVNALLPLLRVEDAGLRGGALDALRTITNTVRDYLPSLLSDADTDVRILSCELARSLPGADATRILSALLTTEQEMNVCAAAIDVLTEVGSVDAIPALEACTKRFSNTPFMTFAIRVATDRILSEQARRTNALKDSP